MSMHGVFYLQGGTFVKLLCICVCVMSVWRDRKFVMPQFQRVVVTVLH